MRSGPALMLLLPVVALATAACGEATTTETEVRVAKPAQATTACMADPSACGFPDVETTGVTPGIALTPVNGAVTLSTPGMVYENREVRGGITVTAPNITIRNVRVIDTSSFYAISVKNGNDWDRSDANLLLDHVEIDLNGTYGMKGIAFNGFTMRNSFIHNGSDCAAFGDNITIEDSLCVVGPDANDDGWPDSEAFCDGPEHFDGFQFDGGGDLRLRHNTVKNPCSQTSAMLISDDPGSTRGDLIVTDNLMAGGGYTLYCPNTSNGNAVITGNRFARTWFPRSGYYGPTVYCEKADVNAGNVWDETGALIPGSASAPPGGGGTGTGNGQGAPPVTSGEPSAGAGPPSPGAALRLTAAQARRLTRRALARELGRRYKRNAKRVQVRCVRRSASALLCRVNWRHRARNGSRERYTGSVELKRLAVSTVRYAMRVRQRSSRCGCSKLIKRTRSVSAR